MAVMEKSEGRSSIKMEKWHVLLFVVASAVAASVVLTLCSSVLFKIIA